MNPLPEDDPVEQMLSESPPYLDDAGFTERVMSALPPQRSPLLTRPRVLVSAAVAAVGALALGASWSVGGPWTTQLTFGLLASAVLGATGLSALFQESEA